MSCNEFNFERSTCTHVDVGFDFSKVLNYTDSSGVIDITGRTFQLIIKDVIGGTAQLTLNHIGDALSTGLYIADPTTGAIEVVIIDTDTLTAGTYPYEMTDTDSDGKISIFMQGTIEFHTRGF